MSDKRVLVVVDITPPRACQVQEERQSELDKLEWQECVKAWNELVKERAQKAECILETNMVHGVTVRTTEPLWSEGVLHKHPQLILEIEQGGYTEAIARRLAWSVDCIAGAYPTELHTTLLALREEARETA